MGALSPAHWLIVIAVVVLLFGSKRLPEAARSLGRSARILKAEIGTTDVPANTATETAEPVQAPAAPKEAKPSGAPPAHPAPENPPQ
jgi:sec-independent protein translocase protein TatA